MKKILLALIVGCAVLVGCGSKVEIPPAHVGKILGKNGYAPDTISPSKFRLQPCFAYCDSLVLLEASDTSFKESMTVFMPKDKLELTVEVRGTLSVPTSAAIVDSLYDRIPALRVDDRTEVIKASKVYEVYGKQALRGVIRSELVKLTISQIQSQRAAVGVTIHAAVQEKMSTTKTPLVVSRLELAAVNPPASIVQAQKDAIQRDLDVQKAEANARVKVVEAEQALVVAKKDRLVKREEAMAIAEQNEIAAKSITPQLLAYRKLETAERIYIALSKSDNVIIIPADSSGFSNTTDNAVLAKLLGKEIK